VDELKLLRDIERLTGKDIEKINLPGYDIDPSIKPEPIQNGRGNGGGGRGRSQGSGRPGASRHGSGAGRRAPGSGNTSRPRASSGNRRAG
jgi:ATP-dependent RNA helicase RhlE